VGWILAPSAGQLFRLVYADVARIITRQWATLLTIALMFSAIRLGLAAIENVFNNRLGVVLAQLLGETLWLFFASPYLISIYQFVATDEGSSGTKIDSRSERASRFFALAALLNYAISTPTIAYAAMVSAGEQSQLLRLTVLLAFLLITLAILARAATILPAAALDPEITPLRTSLEVTRTRFWYCVGTLTLVFLPVFAVAVAVGFISARTGALWPEVLWWPINGALTLLVSLATSYRLHVSLSGMAQD
jgi:uncharacterized membrane protein YhaH (DUF805 family)